MQTNIFQNQKIWVSGLPGTGQPLLARVSVFIHLNQTLTKNSKKKFIAYSFGRNFENRGSHALNLLILTEVLQSSYKSWQLESTHLRILPQNFTMIKGKLQEMLTFISGGFTFVKLFLDMLVYLFRQDWLEYKQVHAYMLGESKNNLGVKELEQILITFNHRLFLAFLLLFDYYRCNNYVFFKVCFCVFAWAWHHWHLHLKCLIT